jgi:hypothetical protein
VKLRLHVYSNQTELLFEEGAQQIVTSDKIIEDIGRHFKLMYDILDTISTTRSEKHYG